MDRPRRSDCTAGQRDGEAGWWTTSGNIGLPPLARVMEVGRQQQPIPINYNRFVENVRVASRRHILRGCSTDYVQGLTDESKNLYEAYKQHYSSNPFNNRTMTEDKRKIWEEVITSTNMTHNSRKAWKTINKLSNDPTSSNPPCLITANQIAHQLLVIQAEATCNTPSNRRRYLKGFPSQRRRLQQRSGCFKAQ